MPVDTSLAAAIVRFTGLGILCHNATVSRAENLFIHEETHTLVVEIWSPFDDSGNDYYNDNPTVAKGDPMVKRIHDRHTTPESDYWYRRQALYLGVDLAQPSSDLLIDIFGENTDSVPPPSSLYLPTTTPPFNRSAGQGEYDDFRWMVNASHDGFMGGGTAGNCVLARPAALTSRLFISNAVIYTEFQAGPKDQTLPRFIYNKWSGGNSTPYGRIADVMGAHIDTDVVKVDITIGEQEINHILYKLDKPHIINITNDAPVSETDMPIYRQFWETTAGSAPNLLTENELDELAQGEYVTGRELCSGIYTDCTESVDDFRPLPS